MQIREQKVLNGNVTTRLGNPLPAFVRRCGGNADFALNALTRCAEAFDLADDGMHQASKVGGTRGAL